MCHLRLVRMSAEYGLEHTFGHPVSRTAWNSAAGSTNSIGFRQKSTKKQIKVVKNRHFALCVLEVTSSHFALRACRARS